MTQGPGFLLTILAFALVIGPLIFLHEMGHYLAGLWCGVKIDAFSVGFGHELFGWTDRRGTRWKFSALPLGGYVKFAGDLNAASVPDAAWLELPPEERARTLQARPVWQRAIVVAAGPVTNFLVAIVIFAGLAMVYGVDATPAYVGTIAQGSAAQRAGLHPGDRIVALGGRPIETFSDLASYAVMRPDERIVADVERSGAVLHVPLTIGAVQQRDRFGNTYRIGQLGIGRAGVRLQQVGLVGAPAAGVRGAADAMRTTADGLGQILSGRRSVNELGGPLRIAKVSGETFTLGWAALAWLAANISINLGFINLLPVPLLDGGHLFFYAVEAARRRPIAPAVQEWAFRGGLVAILALMVTVTVNDLGAFGLWQALRGLIG